MNSLLVRPAPHRVLALVALVGSAAALGVALASERWGGLVPCALCLLERWPYRVAIVGSILAGLLPRAAARWMLGLVCVSLAAAAGLALVHVGVEQGWWPSPLPECAAPRFIPGTIAERLAQMPDHPAKPCDDPTLLVPGLPVSMAAMNLVFAAVAGLGLAVALWASRRGVRHGPIAG